MFKLINEISAYFNCMVACCFDKAGRDFYPLRKDRMLRIIFQNWGMEQPEAEFYLKDAAWNCSSYHLNTVIKESVPMVKNKAALPLYTVCMDIISSGEPLSNTEKDVIYMLQKHLNISQEDIEATNRFSSNRHAALAVTFRAGSAV